MCRVVEERAKEYAKEHAQEFVMEEKISDIKRMLEMNKLSIQEIAGSLNVSPELVQAVANRETI